MNETIARIFQKEAVKKLFHDILTRPESLTEVSDFAPHGEPYVTNQYALVTVMETIVKYIILHRDGFQIESFIKDLEDAFRNAVNYRDMIVISNQLLAASVMQKLGLTNMTDPRNKVEIIKYSYQNYIANGYYFYSFPSSALPQIEEQGLYPGKRFIDLEAMKEVDTIFQGYQRPNIFGLELNMEKQDFIYLTDSPGMAYFYALQTPSYLARFTSNGAYMKDFEKYDINAYYKKDKLSCSKNVENLCNEVGLRPLEKQKVMSYFHRAWDQLQLSDNVPSVAFVKREALHYNDFQDYEQILMQVESLDICQGIALILDSRNAQEQRYTKILPHEFQICKFPTYQSILSYKPVKEEVVVKEEPKVKQKVRTEKKAKPKRVKDETGEKPTIVRNNHGYADVIAMTGFFMLTIGVALLVAIGFLTK